MRFYWAFLSGGQQPNITADPFPAISSLKDVLQQLLSPSQLPPGGVVVLQRAAETVVLLELAAPPQEQIWDSSLTVNGNSFT